MIDVAKKCRYYQYSINGALITPVKVRLETHKKIEIIFNYTTVFHISKNS